MMFCLIKDWGAGQSRLSRKEGGELTVYELLAIFFKRLVRLESSITLSHFGSVKDTLRAVCAMQGIKMRGIQEDAHNFAAAKLATQAMRLRSESSQGHHHVPSRKLDHSRIEILIDVFSGDASERMSSDERESTVEAIREAFKDHSDDDRVGLKGAYNTSINVVRDDHHNIGSLFIHKDRHNSSQILEKEEASNKWNCQAVNLEFNGRLIQRKERFPNTNNFRYLRM
jgi:hypothetical protein